MYRCVSWALIENWDQTEIIQAQYNDKFFYFYQICTLCHIFANRKQFTIRKIPRERPVFCFLIRESQRLFGFRFKVGLHSLPHLLEDQLFSVKKLGSWSSTIPPRLNRTQCVGFLGFSFKVICNILFETGIDAKITAQRWPNKFANKFANKYSTTTTTTTEKYL